MKHAAVHEEPITVGSVLQKIALELQSASSTPRLDAEVLVMHVCGLDRSGLITHARDALTEEQQQRLEKLLMRRRQGEPIAYLTGAREFWSMAFHVSPATLIPRPETELLVEKALALVPLNAEWIIADLGTGCGAIALALAKERPRCRLMATDISAAAVEVARSNIKKFGLTNIELRAGSWLAPLAGEKLDMIVSNPPYVRAGDWHLEQGDARFEPREALIAGTDGLDAIRHVALHAREFLKPGGWLLFEHGWDQAGDVADLLRRLGYHDIVCHQDLAGHSRLTECRW